MTIPKPPPPPLYTTPSPLSTGHHFHALLFPLPRRIPANPPSTPTDVLPAQKQTYARSLSVIEDWARHQFERLPPEDLPLARVEIYRVIEEKVGVIVPRGDGK